MRLLLLLRAPHLTGTDTRYVRDDEHTRHCPGTKTAPPSYSTMPLLEKK